jgi:hypothetical protein
VRAAPGISNVASFAGHLATDVAAIATSIAVLFIALNGLRWITSAGHPGRQAEARGGLVAAVIGLAITLSAAVLVQVVVGALK